MGKIAILDIVMLVALVAGSLNGLRVGALRQLASLVTLYLSVILTTRFYGLLLGPVKRLLVDAPSSMVEGVLFFVLLIIVFAILSVLFLMIAFPERRRRGQNKVNWRDPNRVPGEGLAKTLNHLGGLALGFITASLWIGVGVMIYRFIIGASWLNWESYRTALSADYGKSVLLTVFKTFVPYVIGIIEPWFPSGLPTLFLTWG
jgi:predicted membrane protein